MSNQARNATKAAATTETKVLVPSTVRMLVVEMALSNQEKNVTKEAAIVTKVCVHSTAQLLVAVMVWLGLERNVTRAVITAM